MYPLPPRLQGIPSPGSAVAITEQLLKCMPGIIADKPDKNICLDPPFSGSYLDTQLESSEVKLLKKVHFCVLRGNNTSFSVGLFFLASFKRIITEMDTKPAAIYF